MFRLTREVRFALNGLPAAGTNGFGGTPATDRLSPWVALRLTLAGPIDQRSFYLRNIKEIDRVARTLAPPVLMSAVGQRRLAELPSTLAAALHDGWPGATLDSLELLLSPYCSIGAIIQDLPMTRFSQKFEFSAAHRLHNPALDDATNVKTYGKCNNPHGHGHNYELQVTLAGTPNHLGVLMAPGELERIVHDAVIQRLDHKFLNIEVAEFVQTIPSVENIAQVIYRWLAPRVQSQSARLAGVTVWETPKTWCEYSES